jgi:branched-chain amino acid transport system substrate-binding protein
MKKSKVLVYLLMIITAVAIAGCSQHNKKELIANKKIKIGIILPLTGDAASYGLSLKNGIETGLVQDSAKVSLIYEDSKADSKIAVSAINKLVNVDKVELLLGPFTSSEVLAVAPIAEKNKIVLIAPTASSPAITKAGDYIFRITPSDNFDGQIMANFLTKNLKLKNASVLYINNDYGIGVSTVFEESFKKLGGIINNSISYDSNLKDFKSVLMRIKNSKSSSVYLVGMKEMGLILQQMGELNIKTQVVSIGFFEDQEILKTSGSFSNGVYYSFPSYNADSRDSINIEFNKGFMERIGKKPSILDAYGYDLGQLVSKIIRTNNGKVDFKKAVYQTKNFKGVTGIITFDSNGDVQKSFGIKKIINGKFLWEISNYQISK